MRAKDSIQFIDVPKVRLLSISAAARYLGMDRQTLRKLSDLGELPARRLGGRRVFLLEDLNFFIDKLPNWAENRVN